MEKNDFSPAREVAIRGVQLDLAGQVETPGYIERFVDFASDCGYTHIFLHLEGRIRTETFPYMKQGEYYTPEEISGIVRYSSGKNIQAVPVVNIFGHANHFLKHPEMEHLAELRAGRRGRFSTRSQVFCPSVSETYEFLESYLEEVSKIFPSEYFHAGFDECWDIGYCDLCKKRLESETQADIFGGHLQKCREIVAEKLGKKMIIWDDMFEIYPGALENLARDTVLCSWHYDTFVDRPAGHCGGPRTDKFMMYEKAGFEYFFAPAAFSIRNVESFTRYALSGNPAGALLTVWGPGNTFLFANYATILYAGRLWSGSTTESAALQREAVEETSGVSDRAGVEVIRSLLVSRDISLPSDPVEYLRGPLSNEEYKRQIFLEIAGAYVKKEIRGRRETGGLHDDVLTDIDRMIDNERLYYEIRRLIEALFDPSREAKRASAIERMKTCRSAVLELKGRRRRDWDKYRKGIEPCFTDEYFDAVLSMLAEAEKCSAGAAGLLNITFPFNGSLLKCFVKYGGQYAWEETPGFNAKSMFPGYFKRGFPLYGEGEPEAVRLEARGHVGTGIVYLEIRNKRGLFVPSSVSGIGGRVEGPGNLLENGKDWCLMGEGEQQARRKFLDPALAGDRNTLTVHLAPEI